MQEILDVQIKIFIATEKKKMYSPYFSLQFRSVAFHFFFFFFFFFVGREVGDVVGVSSR